MGRSPCCEADANLKKGPWTSEEDKKLMDYIEIHGAGNWRHLPKRAGLNRCGKSCRLRWTNYLRPDIKRGAFSEEEERLIIHLHSVLGNKWSTIAAQLPGRTDNEIKNYWNTHIRKKLLMMGIDPVTHRPRTNLNLLANLQSLIAAAAAANLNNSSSTANPLMMNAVQLQNYRLLQNLPQPRNINLGSPYALHSLNPTLFGSNITMNENDMLAPLMRGDSCTSSTSFLSTLTTNSTPSLVSASPENFSVDQTLDDLYGDLGWKDILDHTPWGNSLEQNQ